jgi:hypothetical protein
VFIFDKEILDKLEDKDDARVTFIYQTIESLQVLNCMNMAASLAGIL